MGLSGRARARARRFLGALTVAAVLAGCSGTGEDRTARREPGRATPGPSGSAGPGPSGAQPGPGSPSPGAPGVAGPQVSVTIVGDIMLGRRVARAWPGDPGAPLAPMARRLARADITVGNLESTLSRAGRPRQGDDSFAAPPEVARDLRAAGFDVLSLANNHAGDFGDAALLDTVHRVRAAGIAPLGAGADGARAWAPVVVSRGGLRVGFLAFNAIGETPRARPGSPGAASLAMRPRTGDLRPGALSRLQDRVRGLAERADAVVVLAHWGGQYTHRPVADQRTVGRALLDAGATVVVGGHPHWVQDVQRHRGRFVVHSLGNFVFDMDFSRQTREGVVLEMTLRRGALARARLRPVVIGPDFAPRLAGPRRARAILADIRGEQHLPG